MLFLTQSHIDDAFILSNMMSEMGVLDAEGIRRIQISVNAKNKKVIELILDNSFVIRQLHKYTVDSREETTKEVIWIINHNKKKFDLFLTKLSFLV
jgi:hypothetical protein